MQPGGAGMGLIDLFSRRAGRAALLTGAAALFLAAVPIGAQEFTPEFNRAHELSLKLYKIVDVVPYEGDVREILASRPDGARRCDFEEFERVYNELKDLADQIERMSESVKAAKAAGMSVSPALAKSPGNAYWAENQMRMWRWARLYCAESSGVQLPREEQPRPASTPAPVPDAPPPPAPVTAPVVPAPVSAISLAQNLAPLAAGLQAAINACDKAAFKAAKNRLLETIGQMISQNPNDPALLAERRRIEETQMPRPCPPIAPSDERIAELKEELRIAKLWDVFPMGGNRHPDVRETYIVEAELKAAEAARSAPGASTPGAQPPIILPPSPSSTFPGGPPPIPGLPKPKPLIDLPPPQEEQSGILDEIGDDVGATKTGLPPRPTQTGNVSLVLGGAGLAKSSGSGLTTGPCGVRATAKRTSCSPEGQQRGSLGA